MKTYTFALMIIMWGLHIFVWFVTKIDMNLIISHIYAASFIVALNMEAKN